MVFLPSYWQCLNKVLLRERKYHLAPLAYPSEEDEGLRLDFIFGLFLNIYIYIHIAFQDGCLVYCVCVFLVF